MKSTYNGISWIPSIQTGTVPTESFGICGGRHDFNYDFGWNGCIDAPTAIPAGSTINLETMECVTPSSSFRFGV